MPAKALTSAVTAGSVNGPFVAALRELLEQEAGSPLDPLPPGLADSRSRVPFRQVVEIFTGPALHDPTFGLRFAAEVRPGTFGALGYAAMSCATLGDVLPLLLRYGQLVLDVGAPTVRLLECGEQVGLLWEPEAVQQPFPWGAEHAGFRALADAVLGSWYRFGCWITRLGLVPCRVETRAPAPADAAPWASFFGVPVAFGAPHYALWFPRDYLVLPLAQADRALHLAMRHEADVLLEQLQAPDVVRQLANLLAQRLPHGETTLEVMAVHLRTSARTLQRRLAANGLGFQQVLNDTRRRLAERYLAETQWDMLDVALLLGYAEQSAFARAFRGWTGMTPSAWRMRAESRGAETPLE